MILKSLLVAVFQEVEATKLCFVAPREIPKYK